MDERIQNILAALRELAGDNTVPRNIKVKVEEVISILSDESQDMSIKINKVLSTLDEISDDTNIQSYTRTQVWNIASMLEMI
jgi:uncharacterized protein (UPF0147 family)